LVVAGSPSYLGAAQLCLQGASASGCGSLKALVPEAAAPGLWASQPHVVLLDPNGLEQPGALERFDAVVVGPGLGTKPRQSDSSAQHLWDLLQGFGGLLLLDADGLNQLAEQCQGKNSGASSWLLGRQGPTWLTPHGAEFARLFPDLAGRPHLEAAAAAAQASGSTVLLKGAHSVIAAADGRRWQLIETCAEAARAGLGDVLAGYAAGRGAMAVAAQRAVAAERAGPAEGTIALVQAAPTQSAAGPRDGAPALAVRLDGALLAAAGLNHALAGHQARSRGGPGGATPLAVATALAQEIFNQSAEI
jgi:NAD(P)H-hydrate epimerase